MTLKDKKNKISKIVYRSNRIQNYNRKKNKLKINKLKT